MATEETRQQQHEILLLARWSSLCKWSITLATDGCRVLFRPGWDCHGLPIELKIKKDDASNSTEPLKIQEKAGEVARSFIQSQMGTFKKWVFQRLG
uniref:Aminoacyl-tRNA synthetase class Ia domain-containing protein n=1 Tax=Ditylenchus dipsaci TaxID=166011 RepID=A0A915ELL4_9BILA